MTQQCTTHICSTVLCLSFFQCFFISHFKCVHGLLYAGGVVSRWCLHTFLHHFTIQILKIAGMFVAVLGTMAHIRRIFFSLDKTQVQDALRSAGMEADIDPRGHKAMQPEQSTSRLQCPSRVQAARPSHCSRKKRLECGNSHQSRRCHSAIMSERQPFALASCARQNHLG